MKLYLLDLSHNQDRSRHQFDISWEGVRSKDDDTIEIITQYSPPEDPINRILTTCTSGLKQTELIETEEFILNALRKLMAYAFLSGFSSGYQEQRPENTAQYVYQITAKAIQVAVSDDPITRILNYYNGDPTEFIRLLSLLLSEIRIEGFIMGWRIYIKDSGGREPDTKQWLLSQAFTPQKNLQALRRKQVP